MKLHELHAPQGATKAPKRKGRGTATGQGKTAGRGMNGQKTRSGGGVRPGFEGGQMPLQRRLPKFGFNSPNRVEYKAINLSTLQELAEQKNLTKIDINALLEAGFITKKHLVKILGNGELKNKIEVEAHAFSKSAEAAILAVGGSVVKL